MGLILICGLPNAGKTTYSKQFDKVLHLDDFPPNKFLNCNEAVRKARGDVVVEGIYNIRCRREKLLEACKRHDKKVCIWINTPLETCLARGREDIVRRGAMMFQPPSTAEGWDEVIVIE